LFIGWYKDLNIFYTLDVITPKYEIYFIIYCNYTAHIDITIT